MTEIFLGFTAQTAIGCPTVAQLTLFPSGYPDWTTPSWEQRKLGEVASIKTGPFGSLLHAEDYVVDGIPIVTTEHFKSGFLPDDKAGLPQVSESDRARLEQYSAIEGDILFSRVGSVDVNA